MEQTRCYCPKCRKGVRATIYTHYDKDMKPIEKELVCDECHITIQVTPQNEEGKESPD